MVLDLTWRDLARKLADSLEESEDLRSPHWRKALEETPRHLFVPSYYLAQDGIPTPWKLVSEVDGKEWLEPIYTNRTLVTQFEGGGVELASGLRSGVPSSSSTQPGLVIRMLELLEVGETDHVLDLGTGTGYQTALIAHRLASSQQLVSADIDPALTSAAAGTLARLGHTPQLRAVDAMAEEWGCTFDRIIASCALPRIGGSLRSAVREGGRLIANLFPPLNHTLVVLDHQPNGCLEGRFHGDGGSFMTARTGTPPKASDSKGSAYSSGTTSIPQAAFDSYHFQFLLAAHLPGAELQYGSEGSATMRRLVLPGGEWAEATYNGSKPPTWSEAGAEGVWETTERWWKWFNDHDQPTWDRFGLTITPEGSHVLWFEEPTGADVWALV
ncbi:methyltransferase domain-containing protein [Streptomyces jumonjinensis]|uniref:methyltransferase domain-containing protein n=1 Tax=Streptomyces jumonjinensis TaxID=1945 RepID=UPI0037B030EA